MSPSRRSYRLRRQLLPGHSDTRASALFRTSALQLAEPSPARVEDPPRLQESFRVVRSLLLTTRRSLGEARQVRRARIRILLASRRIHLEPERAAAGSRGSGCAAGDPSWRPGGAAWLEEGAAWARGGFSSFSRNPPRQQEVSPPAEATVERGEEDLPRLARFFPVTSGTSSLPRRRLLKPGRILFLPRKSPPQGRVLPDLEVPRESRIPRLLVL